MKARERSIILKGNDVLAALDGTKTQMRVPMKVQPASVERWKHGLPTHETTSLYAVMRDEKGVGWACCGPFLRPTEVGDVWWVREKFYCDVDDEAPLASRRENLYYRANGDCCDQVPECCCHEVGKPRWRGATRMPRWASRLTLRVTGVRVERVRDISCADAAAEGVDPDRRCACDGPCELYRAAFEEQWNADHGPNAWCANAWVWVIVFERVEADTEGRAA